MRAVDKAGNVEYTGGDDCTEVSDTRNKIFLPIVMVPDPNWGFETGDFTSWEHGGQLAQSVLTAMPYSGTYSALLGSPSYACDGGVPVGSAWLRRTVKVPSSGSPTLSFYYRIFTQDKTAPEDFDKLDLFAVSINGSQVFADMNMTENWGCPQTHDLRWRHGEVSLEDYKGKTVAITFYNYNRAAPPWPDPEKYNTYTYLDDVSVE